MTRTVVHFITSPEDGRTNIPLILSGRGPSSQQSDLGTKDFSQVPRAIVFGGGYDDTVIDELRNTVMGTPGLKKVPWVKADQQKTAAGPQPRTKAYVEAIAPRIKEALRLLEANGSLGGSEDGIFSW